MSNEMNKTRKAAFTNRSGTITSGGTAQDVYSEANQPTHYVLMQNISDTDMYIDFGTAATSTAGIKLGAGIAYESPPGFVPAGKLSVLCATTGKAFVCKTA